MSTTRTRLLCAAAALLLTSAIASCGESVPPGPPPAPPPAPPPPPPPGIGPAGGTVNGPAGAQVVIPAGALSANVVIGVAQSNTGAPALPGGFVPFGQIFAFTPHGTAFQAPVTLTIPFDPATVPAGRPLVVYKTNAAGTGWERVGTGVVNGSTVSVQVTGFSWGAIGNLPPSISTQPVNTTVQEPAAAQFSVAAVAFSALSYQWEKSDDGGQTWISAVGTSNTATYTLGATSAAIDHNDRYRVTVSSIEGATVSVVVTLSVTSNVTLPVISTPPQNRTVVAGQPATFTVFAGGQSLSYQWQRAPSAAGTFVDITGATTSSYSVLTTQLSDDNAAFRVIVSNSAGSVTSAVAVLHVTPSGGGSPVGALIAAGQTFSVVRMSDGSMRSWGSDLIGALGSGPGDQTRSVPGNVTISGVSAVGAGAQHALAVRNGGVAGWGYDMFGQLADNDNNSKSTPVTGETATPVAPIANAAAVCGGTLHSLVLLTNGTVLAMGYNNSGQLGDGTTTDHARAVPTAALGSTIATAIACGTQFSLALGQDGRVYGWGANASGQLGNGTLGASSSPVPVSLLGTTTPAVTAISAGSTHALALLANGQVWAWGFNQNGKLGPSGPTSGNQVQTTPIQVTGLPVGVTVVSVVATDENSAVVLSDGRVFVWGINEVGNLGRGSLSPGMDPSPFAANVPAACKVVELSGSKGGGGLNHFIARCQTGGIYTWGWNTDGQLGLGGAAGNIVSTPTAIPGFTLFLP